MKKHLLRLSTILIPFIALVSGCGGGGTTAAGSGSAGSTTLTISPALGKFAQNATVRVKDRNGSVLGTGAVGANGSAAITIPSDPVAAPLIIEAGLNGEQYFDEKANGFVSIDGLSPGAVAIRAVVPDLSRTNIGVTAITEIAAGSILTGAGALPTSANAASVMAANLLAGGQFSVSDPLIPPTLVAATTALSTADPADDYALKLAALAHLAAPGSNAMHVAHALRDDMADGVFDGQTGTGTAAPTAITATIPTISANASAATLRTALQNVANTAHATFAAASPTVTMATPITNVNGATQAVISRLQDTLTAQAGASPAVQQAAVQSTFNTVIQAIAGILPASGTLSESAVNQAVADAVANNTTLRSIVITPANPIVPKGLTQQFTATGTYSDGSSVDITTSVTWSSGTTTVATVVTPGGLSTGVAAGLATITATSGVISGSTTLTVTPPWASVSGSGVQGYTSAIKTDGTLWALADNNYPSTSTQVGTATNWASVSAGSGHTIAIKADGTLWAWGNNYSGQLGNGTSGNLAVQNTTPTQVGTATNWVSVAAGFGRTFAIKTDGTLWAWGSNYSGQLDTTPTQVGTATNWVSVAAGGNSTVAIKTDGTLWAWGLNDWGQIGDGTTVNKSTPTQVGTAADWTFVAAGLYSTFAIKTDGMLWAWGWSENGILGDRTMLSKATPTQVGTANWATASFGCCGIIAIKTDGTLWTESGMAK